MGVRLLLSGEVRNDEAIKLDSAVDADGNTLSCVWWTSSSFSAE